VAALTGAREMDAAATAALSITRLMIMSTTSGSTATGSAATSAIFQASWSSRASGSSLLYTRTWWLTVMKILPTERTGSEGSGSTRANCRQLGDTATPMSLANCIHG
jgi:hypothetical protein